MTAIKIKQVSAIEEQLAYQLKVSRIGCVREYRFGAIAAGGGGRGLHSRLALKELKDWRFDFAIPDKMIAMEVEGGVFSKKKSRHTTGTGFTADCVKYNNAAILGWTVLRVTGDMIKTGQALQMIERAIEARDSSDQE